LLAFSTREQREKTARGILRAWARRVEGKAGREGSREDGLKTWPRCGRREGAMKKFVTWRESERVR
jgi:hypothetical protein